MPDPYPPIEPYDTGLLDVGDGNEIYWEVCGNPAGKPAVVLHGGPGSGCNAGMRRLFDPSAYRIVLLDQRNCSRSTPHASDPSADLTTNTTQHLVADIERLREHLGVDRWLVWGGSWGATLAFAYAEAHPDRVSEIVAVAVTNSRPAEIRWLTRDIGRLFPLEWERFRDGVPPADRDGNLALAYYRLLEDPDPAVRDRASRDWCAWEDAILTLETGGAANPRYAEDRFRLGFARIVTRYFGHDAFLADGVLLRDAHRLGGIPGVLIHGRLDIGSPLVTAWEMARAWSDAELIVLDAAGHSAGTGDATIAALDRFAR